MGLFVVQKIVVLKEIYHMNIKNNILKKELENVYIIGGNACAGKSTMAKMLAKKYGFTLYQMDMHYDEHRSIADEVNQPNMCYPRDDIYAFFNRPVEEYAASLRAAIKEEAQMVLMDLIKLPKDKPIVADVLFTSDDIEGIIPKERAVFIESNRELVVNDYFNRPEKRDFYECVMSFPNADKSFENIFNTVDLINRRDMEIIKNSGYFWFDRDSNRKAEDTLKIVEDFMIDEIKEYFK